MTSSLLCLVVVIKWCVVLPVVDKVIVPLVVVMAEGVVDRVVVYAKIFGCS